MPLTSALAFSASGAGLVLVAGALWAQFGEGIFADALLGLATGCFF